MKRQIVSKEKLQAWLTAELQKVEDCNECTVGGIMALQQPDEDGCNWSDSIVVSTGGVPLHYFKPHLDVIMANARARFNVE